MLLIILLLSFIKYMRIKEYKSSKYYEETSKSYDEVYNDTGTLGEFLTFQVLDRINGYKKIVTNCYIEKNDGSTTELDIVMIHETGIYVFESKNYSGWIFGSEKNKYWTQSLHIGKGRTEKHQFFNPIIQNKVHIKWLKNFLCEYSNISYFSFIVFSQRCSLKRIEIDSKNIFVLNRTSLIKVIQNVVMQASKTLSHEDIDKIYTLLKSSSQVDYGTQQKHINKIKEKHMNNQY